MDADPEQDLAQFDRNLGTIERHMWRLFVGACILNAIVLLLVVLAMSRGANPRLLLIPLLSLLAWSAVMTVYAFYSLRSFGQEIKAQIARSTFIDATTQVFNFRYLEQRLPAESERVRRYGGKTAILYMDLDHFKQVNDRFGHHIGSVVLEGVAQLMRTQVRVCDVLARAGGDEFVVVLPHTDRSQAEALAERLRQGVAGYSLDLGAQGRIDFVRVSIGVGVFPDDGDSMEAVVSAADNALYAEKRKGRETDGAAAAPAQDEPGAPLDA